MLVAGVVLGVVLGPAVLGNLAPHLYDPMFVGSGDTEELDKAREALDRFANDADTRQAIIDEKIAEYDNLFGRGDSLDEAREDHVIDLTNRFADEQDRLENNIALARVPVLASRQAHREKLSGMATAMLLLIVILLAVEAILSPQRDEIEQGRADLPPALSRLITVRYALAAGWLMLMLAQPVWLKGVDPVFGGLLLVVVLLAGLIPLGRRG